MTSIIFLKIVNSTLNEEQLVEKINEVSKLNSEELEQVFKTIDKSLKDNSLSTLNQRLRNYL